MTDSFLETLIPFALEEHSQRLVDVATVPKGQKCGCICPSCQTPLTARQGQKKRWHFAHLSQGVDEHTQRDCHYSLAVSIRLMIRQIARDGLTVMLPEQRGAVRKIHKGKRAEVQYRVSKPQHSYATITPPPSRHWWLRCSRWLRPAVCTGSCDLP